MDLLFDNYLARSRNFAQKLNLKLPEIYQVSSNEHAAVLARQYEKCKRWVVGSYQIYLEK